MNTPLEQFVDAIFVINLSRRVDRLVQFESEMRLIGVNKHTRFEAHEAKIDGKPHGHFGCTASHRGVMELICHNRYRHTAVFEDDCVVRPPFRGTYRTLGAQRHTAIPMFQQEFFEMSQQVPLDFSVLYLGGHYGNVPKRRVSKNIIECNRMLTTSSYIVTLDAARRMAPHISGSGGIDILISGFAERGESHHHIFEPRLMSQAPGYSDLLEQDSNNTWVMEDMRHIKLMDEGKTE